MIRMYKDLQTINKEVSERMGQEDEKIKAGN